MSKPPKHPLRNAVVAGRFYPADPAKLHRVVEACITKGQAGRHPPDSRPQAVISPHAGYAYSGKLAGAAWQATARLTPESIVILSPSHQHAFDGIALPSANGYQMPGFQVAIDGAARQALITAGLAHVEDAAHDREHGIETQLPFAHRLHPDVPVVPLVVGRTTTSQVAATIDALASGVNPPLFILSSDLSHFLTLDAAQVHDLETAKLIEVGAPDRLSPAHACGFRAIAGYLASKFAQGTRVQRLAMNNSHAITNDATRTVGYGAWALFDAQSELIMPAHRAELLKAARKALAARLRTGKTPDVNLKSFATPLRGHCATFVTLQIASRLRGCIGSLTAHQPLVCDVVENTIKSGFNDPRFRPLEGAELKDITIKIAVLSPSRPMQFDDQADLESQLVPHRDGLILSDTGKRGTFLPMVWSSLPGPHAFVQALKLKAGLPKTHWSNTLRVQRFHAESFTEEAGKTC